MFRLLVLSACIGITAIGCAASLPVAAPSRAAGTVWFKVVASPGGEPLGQVVITAATRDGLRKLGETDSAGLFIASAEELRQMEPHAILFCHPSYFCSAIVADATQEHEIHGIGDYYIGLATFMID